MALQLTLTAVGTLPKESDLRSNLVPRLFAFNTDEIGIEDIAFNRKPTIARTSIYSDYAYKANIGIEKQVILSGVLDLYAYRSLNLSAAKKRNHHFYPLDAWVDAKLRVTLTSPNPHSVYPDGEWTLIELHEDYDLFEGNPIRSNWRLTLER